MPRAAKAEAALPSGRLSRWAWAVPLVALLAHETCPVSGECFDTGAGKVSRTFIAQTAGFTDPQQTPETIAARWAEVMATEGARVMEGTGFDSGQWDIRPYDPQRG